MRGYASFSFQAFVIFLAFTSSAGALEAEKAKLPGLSEIEAEAFVILEKGTRSGDMEARGIAVEGIAMIKGKNTLPYVTDALKDPQWLVRRAAINALIYLGNKEYEARINEVLRDPSLPLETEVFKILKSFKPDAVTSYLMGAIEQPDCQTREKLVKAAVVEGGAVMISVFRKGLDSPNPDVSTLFAKAIADVKPYDRQQLLNELAASKNENTVKTALDYAEVFKMQIPQKLLAPVLKSKNEELKFRAAEILALSGDKTALNVLMPLLDRDKESQIRFLKAAERSAGPDIIPAIRKFLSPETPPEILELVYKVFAAVKDSSIEKKVMDELESTILARRAAATATLGKIIGTRALPTLYKLLGDGNPLIRKEAAEAIGELGQAESVEQLQRALSDPEKDVRLAVVKALGNIHDKSVVGVASFLMYDSDQEIRKEAILTLAKVNHESAVQYLKLNINDADRAIRTETLRAIIYLDPKNSLEIFQSAFGWIDEALVVDFAKYFGSAFLPYLKAAVECNRANIREAVFSGLRELKEHEEAFLVEAAATTQYSNVKKIALERLLSLKSAKTVDVALSFLKDGDPDVKLKVISTLTANPPKDAVFTLKELFLDGDERVRVAAAKGLLELYYGKKVK
ncbi:MAG: HEAT repeat domain-containing protein [Deltaproteobacteria bacterium]|nr:HEAT repeat domain-containing protein [Deltaproteobacteria bacterium]